MNRACLALSVLIWATTTCNAGALDKYYGYWADSKNNCKELLDNAKTTGTNVNDPNVDLASDRFLSYHFHNGANGKPWISGLDFGCEVKNVVARGTNLSVKIECAGEDGSAEQDITIGIVSNDKIIYNGIEVYRCQN